MLTRDTYRRIAQLLLVCGPHLNSGYFWVPPRIHETRVTLSLVFLRIATTITATTNTTATITASTIARTAVVSNTGITKVSFTMQMYLTLKSPN